MERRAQDHNVPSMSSPGTDPASIAGLDSRTQPAILIRMLPNTFDASALRNMLLFSKDLRDCKFLDTDDRRHHTAIATFGSMSDAQEAQERLNGKSNEGTQMIVEMVSAYDDHLGSRRNTIDVTNGRHLSTSAASSASSTNPLSRSRFSFSSYPRVQDNSPPLSSPQNTARLQNLFSPTSPVANGISGNSLIHDDLGDEETGQLLNETLPHARNGHLGFSRHSSNHAPPISALGGLSLTTSMTNGNGTGIMSSGDSGVVSPRTFSAIQSPSSITPPSNMGGNQPKSNWVFNRPRQSMPPANPADQNPPCNTLYVGNLPPNTCEDELKALFSRQRGYKRLCFRTKHNGPMCFVEFEDINYAAQTLDNLYGTMLTNSVKGGIRLSFSKNPLGVRRDQLNGSISPLSPQSMGSSFSSGNGAPFATANGPPPGLPPPMPHGQIGFGSVSPQSPTARAYDHSSGLSDHAFHPQMHQQRRASNYTHQTVNQPARFGSLSHGVPQTYGNHAGSLNGSFAGLSNGHLA